VRKHRGGSELCETGKEYRTDRGCRSSPGRARQMNAGAAIANGDILLFLHADTRLPEGFDEDVRRVLSQRGVSGGALSLRLDHSCFGLRLTERLATLRSRLLQMPYGDQAIFVKTELFRRVGGGRGVRRPHPPGGPGRHIFDSRSDISAAMAGVGDLQGNPYQPRRYHWPQHRCASVETCALVLQHLLTVRRAVETHGRFRYTVILVAGIL